MDPQQIQSDPSVGILTELSDLANSIGGDFHTMHLNITGSDFDTMHKDVLKTYYEEAANDYDALAEMVRRKPWRALVPSTNESATRIGYKSCDGPCNRQSVIQRTDAILEMYIDAMNKVFSYFNDKDCPQSQGIASWLQDRLNFWGAEWGFFNASRQVEE